MTHLYYSCVGDTGLTLGNEKQTYSAQRTGMKLKLNGIEYNIQNCVFISVETAENKSCCVFVTIK